MRETRRRYRREFKIGIIRELDSGKTLGEVSREHGIHPGLAIRWRKEYFENPEKAFNGNGNTYKDHARIAELERLIGQLYAEKEFLKKAMTALEMRKREEKKMRKGELNSC